MKAWFPWKHICTCKALYAAKNYILFFSSEEYGLFAFFLLAYIVILIGTIFLQEGVLIFVSMF